MSNTYFYLKTTDAISGEAENKKVTLTANVGSVADGQTLTMCIRDKDCDGHNVRAHINMTKDEALELATQMLMRFTSVSAISATTGEGDPQFTNNCEERRARNPKW